MRHGYLGATVKGYLRERQTEWRRHLRIGSSGRANLAGWRQLEAFSTQAGIPVQHGGDSLMGAA